jgi:selenocysteine lyase/cysteine desulfurase
VTDFINDFPLLGELSYLNTAYTGLLPASTYQWRREHDRAFFEQGSLFREKQRELFDTLREEVASFFHTQPAQVGLLPNFSFGYNLLLDGLPKGSRVLLLENDYPVVNWAAEQRGFSTHYVNMANDPEAEITAAFKSFAPDVFAFSLVQFINGVRLSEAFLSTLKSEYPQVLFLADGTQFLGIDNYNFNQSAIDVIGTSGYKWLLSGFGNGLLLFKPSVSERLDIRTIGFNSADTVDGDMSRVPFFGRFEPGHLDSLNFGSMLCGIRYLKRVGVEEIEAKNNMLANYARERFVDRGIQDPLQAGRALHSTIYSIRPANTTCEELRKKGVICSKRGDGILVSLHFYNSKRDIDRLMDSL